MNKATKQERDQARIKAAEALLPEATHLFARPHPNAGLATRGLSLWHYCEWLLEHGATTGKLKAAKLVEEAHKQQHGGV